MISDEDAKRFGEIDLSKLGHISPKTAAEAAKKGNNMNEQVQKPEATVVANPEAEAFLAKMVKKLEKDGEVLVQTEADVGSEQLPKSQTLH